MNMFESWRAPKHPKNETGPKLDTDGNIVWEEPDMTGIGEPTQERPQFTDRMEAPHAAEEGIAWEEPDMTGVGEITQERTPVKQTEYTAMDAIDFEQPSANEIARVREAVVKARNGEGEKFDPSTVEKDPNTKGFDDDTLTNSDASRRAA